MQTNAPQSQFTNTTNVQQQQPQQVTQPRVFTIPVQPNVQNQTQPQGQQFAGVNIQIFNPAVGTPGAAPIYNVNAPAYGTGLGGCYPSNYYTQQFGPQNTQNTNNTGGTNPSGGASGTSNDRNSSGTKDNANNGDNVRNTTTNNTINETENKKSNKKTEKRKIVQLTDDYIRTLENYLNSQDYEVRLMGAKEVVARVQEDESRKDDKALTALTNKMLQDPSQQIRILALSLLDSRAITGDDYTVGVLKKMQNSKDGYGQDALSATNILLKMSAKTIEKEFEVKDNPKKAADEKK